jgi:hypothetical protein
MEMKANTEHVVHPWIDLPKVARFRLAVRTCRVPLLLQNKCGGNETL